VGVDQQESNTSPGLRDWAQWRCFWRPEPNKQVTLYLNVLITDIPISI
jgi:hypothetical protein